MVIERQYFKPLMGFAIGLALIAVACLVLVMAQSLFTPFKVVAGDSMAPVVSNGYAVTVKAIPPETIKVGELVVYEQQGQPGHFKVERVLAIEDEGYGLLFTTRGDRDPETSAAQVWSSEVLGTVNSRIPYLGTVLRSIESTDGFIFSVAIPGACALVLIFMLALSDKVEKAHRRTGVSISHRAAGAHPRMFL